MERQEDQGEYEQEGQQRVSLNEVEQVRKKVKGLSCEDGLLYHGEAETISEAAAPAKISASRHVGEVEAQARRMLQLRSEMLVQPITQEGGCEALVECAWWVQCTSAPCRNACGAFGHK
ncbi:hypothetical protein O181_111132 [Austropuccinia psidii MF-1]|uniref:Uncharacterized protein n=1 Tax=Austropuccinia psidii MF-1 TaxID=1389203 RepID=A0A9Q3PT34_9BASI|nr:hypothetical protein [Austropuccinia psidii MF-1]